MTNYKGLVYAIAKRLFKALTVSECGFQSLVCMKIFWSVCTSCWALDKEVYDGVGVGQDLGMCISGGSCVAAAIQHRVIDLGREEGCFKIYNFHIPF